MKICVVGLGFMGSALARRLHSLGYKVVLYNRTVDKARKLASELGVEYVERAYECVDVCDIIAVFVSDDEALLNVVLPPNGIAVKGCRGRIMVNMSTVSVDTSITVGKVVGSCGGYYLEAPVLGSVSEVLEGKLITFVAGPKHIFEQLKKVLEGISRSILYLGEVPRAMVLKLAVNQLNHVVAAALAEALGFLRSYGIDLNVFKEVLQQTWMKCIVEKFWDRMLEEKVRRFKLALAAKDLCCFVESARRVGLAVETSTGAFTKFLEATAYGYGERDYTQIGRYMLEVADKLSSMRGEER